MFGRSLKVWLKWLMGRSERAGVEWLRAAIGMRLVVISSDEAMVFYCLSTESTNEDHRIDRERIMGLVYRKGGVVEQESESSYRWRVCLCLRFCVRIAPQRFYGMKEACRLSLLITLYGYLLSYRKFFRVSRREH
jgi:hypothetical protein